MKKFLAVLLLVILFIACSDDSTTEGVTLRFTTSGTYNTSRSISLLDGDVVISDFMLSIREVEFKEEGDTTSTNVKFQGPFVLDLLSPAGPLVQTLGDVVVPTGLYNLVRFKLHKTTDVDMSHPLYDRSIYLEGTINGTNFAMWHDTSENFDITNSGGIQVTQGVAADIMVRFNVLSFLSNELGEINLLDSSDESGDGFIDINPNSDDGTINRDHADDLKDFIKLAADFYSN